MSKDMVNIDGQWVPRGSLRSPLADIEDKPAAGAPVENQVLSRPQVSLPAKACPKLDAEGGRCTMMSISAPTTKGAEGTPICLRQTNRWLGNNLPCGVPSILERPYKAEYQQIDDLKNAITTVRNIVAVADRCDYVKDGGNGPLCNPMAVPCVHPENHTTCKVWSALQACGGVVRGGAAFARVQTAYDQELSELKGEEVSTVNPRAFSAPR